MAGLQTHRLPRRLFHKSKVCFHFWTLGNAVPNNQLFGTFAAYTNEWYGPNCFASIYTMHSQISSMSLFWMWAHFANFFFYAFYDLFDGINNRSGNKLYKQAGPVATPSVSGLFKLSNFPMKLPLLGSWCSFYSFALYQMHGCFPFQCRLTTGSNSWLLGV